MRNRSIAPLTLTLLVTWCTPVSTRASTAGQQSGDGSQSVSAPQTSDVIAELERQLAAVAQSQELGQPEIQSATEALQQARIARQAAASFRARAAEYQATPEDIEAELSRARSALSTAAVIPDPPTDAQSFAELESSRAASEADLERYRGDIARITADLENRTQRRVSIPERTTQIEQSLETLAAVPSDATPVVRDAKERERDAKRAALEAERDSLRLELEFYNASRELIRARRDLAERHAADAAQLVQLKTQWVNARRAADAERDRIQAAEARAAAAQIHEAVVTVARETERMTVRRSGSPTVTGIAEQIRLGERDHRTSKSLADQLSAGLQDLRRAIEAGGVSSEMGVLLRRQRRELPTVDTIRTRMKERQQSLVSLRFERLELAERRRPLIDPARRASATVAQITPPPAPTEAEAITTALGQALTTQRETIDALADDLDSCIEALGRASAEDARLETQVVEYRELIAENVLWIRSAPTLGLADLDAVLQLPRRVAQPGEWIHLWGAAMSGLRARPATSAVLLLALGFLTYVRGRLRRRIRQIGDKAFKAESDSLRITVQALAYSAVIAAFWPGILVLIAFGLEAAPNGAVTNVAAGLKNAALVLLGIELLRGLAIPRGVAATHFRWKAQTLRPLRLHLRWVAILCVPLTVLVADPAPPNADLSLELPTPPGRIPFILGMSLLAWLIRRFVHPSRGVVHDALSRSPSSWPARFSGLWYPLALALPLGFATASFVGYHYTALELAERGILTAWLILLVILAESFILRWSLIVRREVAIAQAKAAPPNPPAALGASPALSSPPRSAGSPGPDPEQEDSTEVDLRMVEQQTRQLARALAGFAVLIGLWFIWREVSPAARGLTDYEVYEHTTVVTDQISSPDGEVRSIERTEVSPITIGHLIRAALVLLIAYVASSNSSSLLELVLLRRLPLGPSSRFIVQTLVQYGITLIALILVFGALGLEWKQIQWLAAALTLGLGFGLQEIVANFVSGLILLLERPIRVGDTVSIGGVSGTVQRIRFRATSIIDWDRKELIVPNKDIVTGQVINWSLSDPILRVTIPVGVAYGSDTRLAREILLRIAREHRHVLRSPRPKAFFLQFGESSLNFELRVFIPSIDVMLSVRHDLHEAIDDAFRAAGIEISFPQRDLHLRSSDVVFSGNQPPDDQPR